MTNQIARGTILILIAAGLATSSVAVGPATTQAVDENKQLESWWKDLDKQEPWASHALLALSSNPAQAVAFLKTHVQPLKFDQKELDAALLALASEDEKIWSPAFKKLKYFDPRLVETVDILMDNATDTLQRQRLAAVLGDYSVDQWKGWDVAVQQNGDQTYLRFSQHNSSSMQYVQTKVSQLDKSSWTRLERAAVLLQHIGTPDAIAILKDIADGNPAAQPTQVAKAALASLRRQPLNTSARKVFRVAGELARRSF